MAVYSKERMTRRVKWFFALPLTYVLYFAFSLLVPAAGLATTVINYLVLILSFCLVTRFLLDFPVRSFIRQESSFSWRLFWTGLLVMTLLSAATSFISMLVHPQMFEYSLRPQTFVADWILSILVVLPAALAEELMFRAFVAFFPSPELETESSKFWKYCLISGLLFTIAHFQNPEVNGVQAIWFMLFYFIFGCFLMYFYMTSGGIEFGLGAHIGNNLVPALFFSYPTAVLTTNTVFMDNRPVNYIQIIQCVFCFTALLFILRFMKKKTC